MTHEPEDIDWAFTDLVRWYRNYWMAQQGQPGNAETVRLAEVRQQSVDDARDRPWLGAKPIYPIGAHPNATPQMYAASLLASLDIQPPDLSRKKP